MKRRTDAELARLWVDIAGIVLLVAMLASAIARGAL